ncbi:MULTISPECIES: hypothetical protein [Bizionia]|uniref:Uncharacterized protein n=1 Tax=Bizionia algoritergicola TaxID=291187 RepID=A0A5D0QU56_9FLAO|nr:MULTISPECIES: hypothetical protein [Bizionia]TYB72336.1 hypothetical protein ES675_11255 [Bizionia algoritergicola]
MLKSKEMLLEKGVKKLKIMGFTQVTKNTILTDEIYQLYFLSFLNNIPNPKNNHEISAIQELKLYIVKLLEI